MTNAAHKKLLRRSITAAAAVTALAAGYSVATFAFPAAGERENEARLMTYGFTLMVFAAYIIAASIRINRLREGVDFGAKTACVCAFTAALQILSGTMVSVRGIFGGVTVSEALALEINVALFCVVAAVAAAVFARKRDKKEAVPESVPDNAAVPNAAYGLRSVMDKPESLPLKREIEDLYGKLLNSACLDAETRKKTAERIYHIRIYISQGNYLRARQAICSIADLLERKNK